MKLYAGGAKAFPEFVRLEGEKFAINADFRNILRILAMVRDANIADAKKIAKLRDWFIPAATCEAAIKAFGEFINPANQGYNRGNPDGEAERQFCYEFDGEEIYAGFLSEYGLDLFECGFLHWHKFRLMLAGLSEASLFKRKIALRFLDLSAISRDLPGFSEIMRAHGAVQLPLLHDDADEAREAREFEDFWERV